MRFLSNRQRLLSSSPSSSFLSSSSASNVLSLVITALLLPLGREGQHFVSGTTVRIVFNNGNEMTTNTLCDNFDNQRINEQINKLGQIQFRTRRRNLRRQHRTSVMASSSLSNDTAVVGPDHTDYDHYDVDDSYDNDFNKTTTTTVLTSSDIEQQQERTLYMARCKDLCAGYKPGTCRTAKCVGYRRRRELNKNTNNIDNGVQQQRQNFERDDNYQCTMMTNTAHSMIIRLMSVVSPTCASFIEQSKRSIDCVDDSSFGEIINMSLYDEYGDLITDNLPATGFAMCTYKGNLRFQAMVNECTYNVQFALRGGMWHDEIDRVAPFQMYTRSLDNAGRYELYIYPNSQQSSLSKQYIFDVFHC